MEGTVNMSRKELKRLALITRLGGKDLTPAEVSERLGICSRQVRRLLRAYQQGGEVALRSKKRGSPSSRKVPIKRAKEAMDLVREKYWDFGPTLACEKLREVEGLRFSVETVRTLMTASSLWAPKKKKRGSVQQPRPRRDCFGELVQIDGSDHEWFEERGERCMLLVFIDDATGRLTQLHFAKSESTFSYFDALEGHIRQHGKPVALYSDRHAVFRVNTQETGEGRGTTQFSRALETLDIAIICARTPAAKGRVERANQTLQDRLVKELRLRNISTIEAANDFAEEYVRDFNRRFAVKPAFQKDAHRLLEACEVLSAILQWREKRKVSSRLTIQYNREKYILKPNPLSKHAMGKNVTVIKSKTGEVRITFRGIDLPATHCQGSP